MFELPQKEQTPPSFETWLSLKVTKQYESQIKTLDALGLLQILPESGEYGILDISGTERPVPELDDIKQAVLKNKEFYHQKWEQGFTELEMTPFGLPLSTLVARGRETILKHHKEGRLFQTKKNQADQSEALVPLDLDTDQPLFVWEKLNEADELGTMVYDPKQFTGENHGGRTKRDILKEQEASPFPGFLVSFQEKSVNIPRQGKGRTVGGRIQLEANQTPSEYLKKLQTETVYQGESGETPEEWLIRLMTSLTQTGQVIDDYQGHGSLNYLTGAWVPASGVVPSAYWDRGSRRAYLVRDVPRFRSAFFGCRSAVRVY